LQYLELVASIKRCRPTDWPASDLLDVLSLRPWAKRLIGEYSFGTRAKLAISAALLGCPPLLILDESLNGLDPVASFRLKQLLRQLARSGDHAVILSTHQLETVAGLCDSAALLSEGRISQCWNRDDLAKARAREGGFELAVMTALGEAPMPPLEPSFAPAPPILEAAKAAIDDADWRLSGVNRSSHEHRGIG
jgi:ABC-2 type transport system ATP-binding protein